MLATRRLVASPFAAVLVLGLQAPAHADAPRQVDAGAEAACAIAADGQVLCWGSGLGGAQPPSELTALDVANFYACGLTAAEAAVCWGAPN